MRNKKHIKNFNELTENLNTSNFNDGIKNRNVYVPLGRGISGNWDDGYEF